MVSEAQAMDVPNLRRLSMRSSRNGGETVQTEMTVADGERFAAIVWQTYAKYFNVTVEPLNQRKKERKQDDRPV